MPYSYPLAKFLWVTLFSHYITTKQYLHICKAYPPKPLHNFLNVKHAVKRMLEKHIQQVQIPFVWFEPVPRFESHSIKNKFFFLFPFIKHNIFFVFFHMFMTTTQDNGGDNYYVKQCNSKKLKLSNLCFPFPLIKHYIVPIFT